MELVEVYRHQFNPLELVLSAQSFQNADRIDKVFSKLLKRGLWDSVLQLRVRFKDDPANETSFSSDHLNALRRIFDLRHELVHDPARRSFFTEKTLQDLDAAAFMIFGSDLVLSEVIQANRDPELERGAGA